jgi:hypothetical protein
VIPLATLRRASQGFNETSGTIVHMSSRNKGGRPSKGPRRQLPAVVPIELAREIEERAEILKRPMNDLVNEAIAKYLASTPRPQPQDALLAGLEEVQLSRTA